MNISSEKSLATTSFTIWYKEFIPKAELLQESIHLFAKDILVMKKLDIEKSMPTLIISVLKIEY